MKGAFEKNENYESKVIIQSNAYIEKKISKEKLSSKISEMKSCEFFYCLNKKFRKYLLANVSNFIFPGEKKEMTSLLDLVDNFGNIPFNTAAKYSRNDFIRQIKEKKLITGFDKHLSKSNNYGISGYYFLKDNELQDYFLALADKPIYPIPHVVIELNKTSKTSSSINLIMKIVLSERLKATMMQHKNKNNIYLLVDINEEEFCIQAEKEGIELKLLDKNIKMPFVNSEDYKNSVEPFLSRHYQEIISDILSDMLDVEMLKSQGVINKIFYTHKPNVTQKIFDTIIRRWIPNPLPFFGKYLKEGKQIIFKEIDLLYRYFGEAAAIYYTFFGYLTINYSFIAVIGLVYAFIYLKSLFRSNDIYPTFFIIFTIWNLVFIFRWRRKIAEIQHKWGMKTSALMREIRDEFRGDEYVRNLDDPLQKHVKRYSTLKVFLASLPLIIILLAADIVVFYYTTRWENDTESNPNLIFQYLPSIVRSIGLMIISYIYDFVANFFAEKENHKFQEVYNNTLIIKIFSFRLIADLASVLYSSLVQKDIQNLKVLLYTNLIIKYLSEIGIKFIMPFAQTWFFTRRYFQFVVSKTKSYEPDTKLDEKETKVMENMERQKEKQLRLNNQNQNLNSGGDLVENEENKADSEYKSNEVKYSKVEGNEINLISVKNVIIEKNTYRTVAAISGQLNQQKAQFNFNPDFIEVTNILGIKGNLIYDYADLIIIHTICSMFSILIPFGPVIVLFFSLISQNMRLYADLYFYQRAPGKQCEGIGLWYEILELISVLSVVFNCFLYYFYRENYLTSEVIADDTEINIGGGEKSLFILVISEHVLILIQYALKYAIPSVPSWVVKEREFLGSFYQKEIAERQYRKNEELKEQFKKYEKMCQQKIAALQSESQAKDARIKEYEKSLDVYKNEILSRDDKINSSRETITKLLGMDKNKNGKLEFPRLRHIMKEEVVGVSLINLQTSSSEIKEFEKKAEFLLKMNVNEVKEQIDLKFDSSLQKIVQEMLKNQKILKLEDIEKNTKNVMRVYFFSLLKKTLDRIEKEIMSIKYEKYISNVDRPIVICDYCLRKRATFICEECNEIFCYECKRTHLSNPKWKEHTIQNYVIPLSRTEVSKLASNEEQEDDDKFIYVKMENFSFPIHITNNLGYDHLESTFKKLYDEYLTNNGIGKENIVNSKDEIQRQLEFLTKLSTTPNKTIDDEITKMIRESYFNCEEMFFINRVSFKVFTHYGAKCEPLVVYASLKKLQTGNFEEKIILLLHLLDIYDNGIILRDEFQKFFLFLTVQNFTDDYSIENILNIIFSDSNCSTFKDLYHILTTNNDLKNLLSYLLQVQ